MRNASRDECGFSFTETREGAGELSKSTCERKSRYLIYKCGGAHASCERAAFSMGEALRGSRKALAEKLYVCLFLRSALWLSRQNGKHSNP